MERISRYVDQLLNGENSALNNVLKCIEDRDLLRLDDKDVKLFAYLVEVLLKDGRRVLSSDNNGSRPLPTEYAVLSLRILQTALTRNKALSEQARKPLRQAGVGVCREFWLDRYFGLKAWMIPCVVRFIVCLTLLFKIRATDILSIPANLQLVEYHYARMTNAASGGMNSPGEVNERSESAASPTGTRRHYALPKNPSYVPNAKNPLYDEGGENVWMSPQFPTPVLDLCRQCGLGCDPKLPGSSPSNPPNVPLAKDEPSNDPREIASRRAPRRLDEALCFEKECSSLLQSYLSKGTMLMWGNWSSLSGRGAKVPTYIVSRKQTSPPCVIQPLGIVMPVAVLELACGANSSYILTLDNKLHSCGCGHWGQLGSEQWKGDVLPKKSLMEFEFFRVLIRNEEHIIRVAPGSAFALALSHRRMYLWGQNSHGQCLTQDFKIVPCPRSVAIPPRYGQIKDASCGNSFVAVVFEDGRIGTWGSASMLGISLPPDRLRTNDAYEQEPCSVTLTVFQPPCERIQYLRAGPWHCLAITEDGQVFSWGEGRGGRLGHGDEQVQEKMRRIEKLVTHAVVDASCGAFHSSVLTKDGLVFVFGENSSNQLGLPGQHNRLAPEQLHLPKCAIALSCGREHTCILLEDGDLMSCGTLRASGAGYGYGARLLFPRRVLQSYIIFNFSSGSMHGLAVGLLRSLTLQFIGFPSEASRKALNWMNTIASKSGIRCVGIGKGFVILVTESGEAHAFGKSQKGQLGCGHFPPGTFQDGSRVFKVDMGGQKIGSIDCGIDFALAVTTSGNCFSWGSNSHGQLGHGENLDLQAIVDAPRSVNALSSSVVVQVACGGTFSLALTQDGELYSWGEGRYCGHGGSSAVVNTPTLLRGLENVVTVAAGLCHVVVLTSQNIIYTWGRGPLGNGGTLSTTTSTPIALTFPHNVRQLGCGPLNSYAITDECDLFLWGLTEKRHLNASPQNDTNNNNNASPKAYFLPTLVGNKVRCAAFALTSSIVLKEDGTTAVTGTSNDGRGVISSRSSRVLYSPEPSDPQSTNNENFSSSPCFVTSCFGGYDILLGVQEWKRPKTTTVQEVIAEMKQRVGMESIQSSQGRY